MENCVDSIDYQVAYASMRQEAMERLQQVNTIQIEFLRNFECQVASPQTHPLLVYHIRNMIFAIEDIYEGTKQYFQELNMEFMFALFRKIQVLMVNGYNFLAQALLSHLDQAEIDRELKLSQKNREDLLMRINQKGSKEEERSKALEHCDFTINYLQMEQAKLKEQMQKIQDHLWLSKGLVDKLSPSKAVKELTEIKDRSQITLENTQRIFEETYQLKYLQFKNYLSTLQHPQDITKQFCQNIRVSIKDKFTQGMKKSVNTLYQAVKQNQRDNMIDHGNQTEDLQKERPEKKMQMKHGEKMQNLLVKQRRVNEKLQADIKDLKKQIENWRLERNRLNTKISQLSQKHADLVTNYEILTKLYEEKREENAKIVDDLGKQSNCILELRAIQAKYLTGTPKKNASVQANLHFRQKSQGIQVWLEDDHETILVLRKHNEKLKERIADLEKTNAQLKSKKVLRGDARTDFKLAYIQLAKENKTQPTQIPHKMSTLTNYIIQNTACMQDKTSMQTLLQKSGSICQLDGLIQAQKGVLFQQDRKQIQQLFQAYQQQRRIEEQQENNRFKRKKDQNNDISEKLTEENTVIQQPEKLNKYSKLDNRYHEEEAQVNQDKRQPKKYSLIDTGTQTTPLLPAGKLELESLSSKKQQQSKLQALLQSHARTKRINKTLKPAGHDCPQDGSSKRTESFTIRYPNQERPSRQNKHSRFDLGRETCYLQSQCEEYLPHPRMNRQHFEQLNIQCEQNKNFIQKRSILSKSNQFLISSLKNKTDEAEQVKHAALAEETFKETKKCRRKSQTNREGMVMLAIDKLKLKHSTVSKDHTKMTVMHPNTESGQSAPFHNNPRLVL